MNKTFPLIAQIEAKPEHRETIKKALQSIVEPTLKEKGCLLYELHQDNNNPNQFMFYEIWATRTMWEAHNVSPHISAHKAAHDDKMANFTLYELSKI